MGLTFRLGQVPLAIFTDTSNNVGIGAAANASFKLQVTGATNLTGALTGTTSSFTTRVDIGTRSSGNIRNLNIYGATNNNAIIKLDGADGNGYGAQIDFISKTSGGTSNTWTLGTGVTGGANAFELFNGSATVLNFSQSTGAATFSSSVGIGNTATADRLSVTGVDFQNTAYLLGGATTGASYGLQIRAGSNSTDYALQISNRAGGEMFRVRGDGNVGIGTSSPTAIGAYKSITINGADGGIFDFMYNGTLNGRLFSSNDASVGMESLSTTLPLVFKTQNGGGSTERMRITSGGVTLFGGTTFTTITSAVLGATNPSFTGRNWSFGPNSSGDYVVYHNQGGNTGVYLSYGGSSWTSNSDENIKDIIEIIPNALESIINFRAVKFYWKGDESKKENIGLIAQDVQKSYPELIDKQIFDDKEILGVRYTELIPVLVKAIQELTQKVNALENK